MDADTFLEDIRAAHRTELSRLSSSKAVYALTRGEMDGDAVRRGIARELHALAPVLDGWADDADGDVADLFAEATDFAANAAESFDSGAAAGGDSVTHVTADALGAVEPADRPAAMAAAFLVLEELAGQLVGFFVGDADRKSADEFRAFRGELGEFRDAAADLLADRADDGDWEDAHEVGTGVVEGAYDWYVGTLESMGVEPKNVC
ncbi:hypothetical protein JCM30237_16600 [Halolamina litorea]|uniref:Transcription antitermination protein n=1 Tax=Halolamina litorea TaxID=1515593 RepID=A0ABD6BTG3_9EURY|nr:transcription antitermination protein [Halolamina litorea]